MPSTTCQMYNNHLGNVSKLMAATFSWPYSFIVHSDIIDIFFLFNLSQITRPTAKIYGQDVHVNTQRVIKKKGHKEFTQNMFAIACHTTAIWSSLTTPLAILIISYCPQMNP